MPPPALKIEASQKAAARRYYDAEYHQGARPATQPGRHLCQLARCAGPFRERRLLDVACGTGEWLMAAAACGAIPSGVDISQVALEACRKALPNAALQNAAAEQLPFADSQFDIVSCLGALEHFSDPLQALREMRRVAKADAKFLLLVPNAGFLPRRLGLYGGTEQTAVREDVLSLPQWQSLFESAGLKVEQRWRDLHVVSTAWICRGSPIRWPLRAAQALALPVWPLSWQYQVYHLCRTRR